MKENIITIVLLRGKLKKQKKKKRKGKMEECGDKASPEMFLIPPSLPPFLPDFKQLTSQV